jgi:hypothetical protein
MRKTDISVDWQFLFLLVMISKYCPCFCFVHTIAQFSRILRFSHIYCQIFRIVPFVDGSRYKINGLLLPLNSESLTEVDIKSTDRYTTTEFRMHYFNDRIRKVPKDIILAQYFEIMTKRKRNYQSTDISVFLIAC